MLNRRLDGKDNDSFDHSTKPRVYVETTILSYLAARPSRDVVTAGRQLTTQQWWENERRKYTLVGSSEVRDEC